METNQNEEDSQPSRPDTLELYTIVETAAILNVSRRTVSNWIREGTLPAIRLGPGRRLIRIQRTDLEAFVQKDFSSDEGKP